MILGLCTFMYVGFSLCIQNSGSICYRFVILRQRDSKNGHWSYKAYGNYSTQLTLKDINQRTETVNPARFTYIVLPLPLNKNFLNNISFCISQPPNKHLSRHLQSIVSQKTWQRHEWKLQYEAKNIPCGFQCPFCPRPYLCLCFQSKPCHCC